MRGMEKHQCVDGYIAELCEWLWEAFKEVQAHSMSEAERQKVYYDRRVNAISLETGDLVLAKADAYRGKRNVKDQWDEEPYVVEHQVAEGVPLYIWITQQTGCLWILYWNWLFLIAIAEGNPLCMVIQAKGAQCTLKALEEQTLERSETEEAPRSVNCHHWLSNRQLRLL